VRRHAKATAAGSTTTIPRRLLAPLASLAFIVVMALGSTATQADLYPLSSFGSFANPAGVAVKQSSGNVYVADQGSNNVSAFDNAGAFLFSFGKGVNATTAGNICTAASGDECVGGTAGSANGAFDNPQGIAVDQTTGAIYVVDAGNRRIQKFDQDGNFLLAFGTPGTGNGQFSAWSDGSFIAVGPGGNVFVGDGANNPRIQKFSSAGAFIEEFTGINSSGGVYALAVDSAGNLYDDDGQAAVHKLNASGVQQYDLGVSAPTALATDPASDDVFVLDASGPQVVQFDSSGAPVGNPYGAGVIGNARGLAYDSSDAVLYVADPGCACLRSFGTPPVAKPQVESTSASNQTPTGATLEASINPEGAGTTYYFEYATQSTYFKSETYDHTQPVPPGPSIGEGFAPQTVSESITGLEGGTTYHYRVVAINAEGTTAGPDQTFSTSPKPVIDKTWSEHVTGTSATIAAAINPMSVDTAYHFEFGTTTAYGKTTPVPDGLIDPGDPCPIDGNCFAYDPKPKALLGGLQFDTTYHFRVIATSANGETIGPDKTFHTFAPVSQAAGLPDGRAYEMVSPPAKSGADVMTHTGKTSIAPDGNGVTYASQGSFPGSYGNFIENDYAATRGADGWTTHFLTPHQLPIGDYSLPVELKPTNYQLFTPDLSKGVILAHYPLTADPDVGAVDNLYLRDDIRSGGPGHYQLLSGCPGCSGPLSTGELYFVGASADMDQVLFESNSNLTGETAGDKVKAYKWDKDGGVTLEGKLPSGEPALCPPPSTDACSSPGLVAGYSGVQQIRQEHVISSDGSRVIFGQPQPPTDSNGQFHGGDLYMRIDSALTVQLNVSERAVEDSPRNAEFKDATPDGSKVFFTTAQKLTEDDANEAEDLYMYEVDAPAGEHLTLISQDTCDCDSLPRAREMVGSSADGSYVYFMGEVPLLAGQERQKDFLYIYVWHDGEVRYVGAEKGPGEGGSSAIETITGAGLNAMKDSRISADGRSLLFNSNSPENTPYDIECIIGAPYPCNELFLYRYQDDSLTCVSCNPTNSLPVAATRLSQKADGGIQQNKVQQRGADVMTADGNQVYFTTLEAMLPQDANGHYDVYRYNAPDGSYQLISTGQCNCDSRLAGISPDAHDVFFTTRERLVGIDVDTSADLYDARVNGGIAAQNPNPGFECNGDACQSPPSPPNDPTPASSSFNGAGNQKPAAKKKKHRKAHHKKRAHKKRAHERAANNHRGGAK
jgi:DNA-binding beta-propeller fold protein YncE